MSSKKQKLSLIGDSTSKVYRTIESYDVVNPSQEVFQSARKFDYSVKFGKTTKRVNAQLSRRVSEYEQVLGHLQDYALVAFLSLQVLRATQRETFQASTILEHSDELDKFFASHKSAKFTLGLGLSHKEEGSDKDTITLDAETWDSVKSVLCPALVWRYEQTAGEVATRSRSKRVTADSEVNVEYS